MNRIAILFLLGISLPAYGAESLHDQFDSTQKINGIFEMGQQGRLRVNGALFDQSHDFPNDLRIIDNNGTQWPFFLHIPQETQDKETLVPNILNRSFVSGDESYLQFDLVLPTAKDTNGRHNQIELITSGEDYVRRVEIYTGNPPAGLMATGYLIDFPRQRNARNQIIRYPDSDTSRLHIRIYSNALDANETFDIIASNFHYRTLPVQADREIVGFQELDVPESEKNDNAQTHILDLKYINRPVEFITFKTSRTSFARSVAVYGRNTLLDSWIWEGGGTIYSLENDHEIEIELEAASRFLKVQIFHYDDTPLPLEALELAALPRSLVFEAASAGEAELCFGSLKTEAPRYDLIQRIDQKTIPQLVTYSTQQTITKTKTETQPWCNHPKLFSGLAVGFVSLLVLWVITRMFRNMST